MVADKFYNSNDFKLPLLGLAYREQNHKNFTFSSALFGLNFFGGVWLVNIFWKNLFKLINGS
jgi:hypothetical protein